MKQLSDCGRLINFASLKLIVSTSVTINSFLTFTYKGNVAINHLFGFHKIVVQNGADGWVITKSFIFSLKAWHAPSSKLRSVKISEKILLGRVKKLNFWFQSGVCFGGMGEGERMVVLCCIINNINLVCFKGCNIRKELIRCTKITAMPKPPESMAGGVPVFYLFFLGGRGWISNNLS